MKAKILLLILLLVALTTKSFAYDIAVANNDGVTLYYNYINDGKELAVTSGDNYDSYSGSIDIPEEVTYMNKTLKVTSIGFAAFNCCSGITAITIPNSVTIIEEAAFYWSGLTSITIPNSVTSIGNEVFFVCSNLTSITIPNSVISIGTRVLEYCEKLTSIKVETENPQYDSRNNCNCIIETQTNKLIAGCNNSTIPDDITEIGDRAFSCCSGLTSITIPNTVTNIGLGAFGRCSGLTSITIPNSVRAIGSYAFSECSSFGSITIPKSVISMGENVFGGCSGLTSIIVDTDNTKYDSRNNCNGIIETETNTLIAGCQNTLIPENVTSIGNSAFSDCKNLTSITIPNSVTNIGASAFYSCSALTSVTLPENLVSIGASAFNSCSNLTSITLPNNLTTVGSFAFFNCGFTSIIIPSSISSIEDYVFCGSKLTSITIPNSVTSIGDKAFDCWDLKEVISYIDNPFNINTNTFSDNTYNYGTLYVPAGTVDKYKATESWKNFKNIEESASTSITDIGNEKLNIQKRYTLDGRLIESSHKGLNIIRMNNGKTKKVVVK